MALPYDIEEYYHFQQDSTFYNKGWMLYCKVGRIQLQVYLKEILWSGATPKREVKSWGCYISVLIQLLKPIHFCWRHWNVGEANWKRGGKLERNNYQFSKDEVLMVLPKIPLLCNSSQFYPTSLSVAHEIWYDKLLTGAVTVTKSWNLVVDLWRVWKCHPNRSSSMAMAYLV